MGIEKAEGTTTTVCGIISLIQAASLVCSLILRTKALRTAGAEVLALEHGEVVFHPLTSAWFVAYYCWNFLFVSATGSPDRTLHDFTGILATIVSFCVDPNRDRLSLTSRFFSNRIITLAAFGCILTLLECFPLFRDIPWSGRWGFSDEPVVVFVSIVVAIIALGDLTNACVVKDSKHR